MPSLLTPSELDRRPTRGNDNDRDNLNDNGTGDIGNGRKPPRDKRTGGNGDGDNWNDRPQGRRGPRERLSQARVGMIFALGGDLMFFVAIISVFFVNKSSGHFDAYSHWVNSWLPTQIPSILWLNTAVLALSSFTAELGRRSMFREQDAMEEWFGLGKPMSRRAGLRLGITLIFGAVFLAGQWVAWQQLASQHVFFGSSQSSHFFYLITVTHAVHLLLGIGGLIWALAILRHSRALSTRQVIVDSTVWYWHVMGILWVFLFVLLEYGQ